MTVYNKASLVLAESPAYKAGTIQPHYPLTPDVSFDFTRATSATRVNADGNIEKETQNLLLQSNQFDTTWGSATSTLTSGQSGYDGSNDAWKIAKNQANAQINQSYSDTSVKTLSIYAKADTLNWIAIVGASGSIGYFDLVNGVVGTTGGSVIDTNIESAGNGWWRCSVSSAATTSSVTIYPADADNDISGTSGSVYIQDAQLEQGLVARDYQETTTSAFYGGITDNVPRLDYTDGSCPSVLLEPQRTNAILQSEYLNAIWGKTSVSVTSNAAVSPEGVQNAAKLVETNELKFHFVSFGATINAEPTTFSFYAKAAERTSVSAFLSQSGNVGAIFDLSAETATASGTGNTASIESVGNDWYRCVVINDGSADLNNSVRIGIQNGALDSYQGDGTSGVYIWGAQLEINASYPTSYIPTYGTSVTRSRDLVDNQSLNPVLGDGDLTILYDFNYDVTGREGSGQLFLTFSGTDFLGIKGTQSINRSLQIFSNGGFGNNITFNNSSPYATRHKVLLRITSDIVELFYNGSKHNDTINTNGIVGSYAWDRIKIDATNAFFAELNQVASFNTALTDSECIALTTL